MVTLNLSQGVEGWGELHLYNWPNVAIQTITIYPLFSPLIIYPAHILYYFRLRQLQIWS